MGLAMDTTGPPDRMQSDDPDTLAPAVEEIERSALATPEKLSGGGLHSVIAVLHEKPAYLDGPRQLAAAHEALVEHIFEHLQQDAGLGMIQQR